MSDDEPGRNDDGEQFDGTFARADPEQVARKLYSLQNGRWENLPTQDQARRVAVIVALLTWLRDEGAEP